MYLPNRADDARPTPDQELLLRAALLEGAAAAEAWRVWKERNDIEVLDRGSQRLLPLLYRNLEAQSIADPLLEKLKGVWRYHWSRTHLLFRKLAGLLEAFHARGLETLVLKGAALAVMHYRDLGARPMADLDVLVPALDARRAMALLRELGWEPMIRGMPPEAHLAYRHATGFRDPTGAQLDLHWHILLECCDAAADRVCWQHAVPAEIAGVATCVLAPTEQLLHVCVHGASWSAVPPMRWIADAVAIMRAAPAGIDWDRLVAHARSWRLGVILAAALGHLRTVYDAPVPPDVLAALATGARSPLERLEHRVRARRRGPRLLGDLPVVWFNHARLARAGVRPRGAAGFLDYLRYHWGLPSVAQVPLHVLRKALRRGVGVPSRQLSRGDPSSVPLTRPGSSAR